jgi:hypothetical protein
MANVIIACDTLKYEVLLAQARTDNTDPVYWVDGMLHMDPDRLRMELQKVLDQDGPWEHVLFAYGNCGNGLVGLKSEKYVMVVPKTADCISMLLHRREETITRDTYFLTKGWIELEKNIIKEYTHCLEKYGEEKTQQIFKVMLNNYHHLTLIDSGAYDIQEYIAVSMDLAQKVHLDFSVKRGGVGYLEKLFQGSWDQEFCIIEKNRAITMDDFGLSGFTQINTVPDFM